MVTNMKKTTHILKPYRSEVAVVHVINAKKGSRGIASFIFHLVTRRNIM